MSDFFDRQDFLAVFAPAVMPSLLKKEVTAMDKEYTLLFMIILLLIVISIKK